MTTIIRREVVDSTNDEARALVAEGAEAWTVIVAEAQVAGKGRFGRTWASPAGGLYLSIILPEKMERFPLLNMVASLSVVDALAHWDMDASVKWPNDVHVRGAKVAGILVEGLVGPEAYWAVVGIGINSDLDLESLPTPVRAQATTLRHELGRDVDNGELLEELLAAFRGWGGQLDEPSRLVNVYASRCSTLNHHVTLETGEGLVRGRAVSIRTSGALVVRTDSGQEVEITDGTVLESG